MRSRPAPRGRVLLWPDTFNNHFFPEVAQAALEVLEDAGYQVTVPRGFVCCGRPLYDYGMMSLARRRLHATMSVLRREVHDGVPIVGLEPSCVSVFRDELKEVFPKNGVARQLAASTFLFGEFLERENLSLPRLEREAIVHGHCHQKSVLDRQMKKDAKVFERMGLSARILDSGCCGMAGSFGYEAGRKYEVSMQVGEKVLLPAVRDAAKSQLLVADGFSCREQIAQTTDRRALHLAQVVRMAGLAGPAGPSGEYPERGYVSGGVGARTRRGPGAAVLVGAAVGLGTAWWLWSRRAKLGQ